MKATIEASVDEQEALRYLGHKGQALGPSLEETLHRIALKVNILEARGVALRFPIASHEPDAVTLGSVSDRATFVLPGSHIARHLRDATEAVLLAVTLGFESERLIKQCACVSATDGLIADACASSLVESAVEAFNETIVAEARERGMTCGKRFSPGYGNFPLAIQRDFVSAIGADKALGICVTDGDLMVPAKSVTAVIPLVPATSATPATPAAAPTQHTPAVPTTQPTSTVAPAPERRR